jgi:C4-dicarboxylate transporter DctQ subunit
VSQAKAMLKRILGVVRLAEVVLCSIGLFATTLLIFAQVLNRYWLHFEIMIFGDLALYLFIFFMLLAATMTTWREGHVSVDFFRDKLLGARPMGMAVYRVVIVVLSIVILCIFLPTAYQFMLQAIRHPQYGTLVRWFNTSWLQTTLFVASTLVLVHLLVIAGRDINQLRRVWQPKTRR